MSGVSRPSQWYRLSKPSRDRPVHRFGGSLPHSSNTPAHALSATTGTPPRASAIQFYEELPRNWNVSPLSDREKANAPEYYEQLCEGECEIGWTHVEDADGETVVNFFVRLPPQENILIHFGYRFKHVPKRGAPGEKELRIVKDRACGDERTATQLTQDRQDYLFPLLPLRFFFEHGAAFCVAHSRSFYALCDFESIQAKKKKIALLWCCIPCDVALTINDDEFLRREGAWSSPKAFNDLATCMEAAGSFKNAGCVYEIAAARATLPEQKSAAHNNAGLAYRRVHLFSDCEDQYLAGLRESFPTSTTTGKRFRAQLSNAGTSLVVNNLLTVYMAWRISEGEESSSPAEPWLCLLLARNGFKATRPQYRKSMLKHYEATIILPKLTKAKAQEHLMEVIKCTTKEDFYAKLLELRNFGEGKAASSPRLWPISRETLQHFAAKDQKDVHQESACGLLGQPAPFLEICGGCRRVRNVTEDKFLQCARCRSISYCTKECQIKHWKTAHREFCKAVDTPKSKKKTPPSSGS